MHLMQELDRVVVEQEPMIEDAERKAVHTRDHLVAGNMQMDCAVDSSRAARRKKWICAGITVAVSVVIAVVVVIVVMVMNGNNNDNRQ